MDATGTAERQVQTGASSRRTDKCPRFPPSPPRRLDSSAVRFLFLLFIVCADLACAQGYPLSYPTKPIRFIAPFPPGGSSDVLCRVLGQKLSDFIGQPVVVENRAG